MRRRWRHISIGHAHNARSSADIDSRDHIDISRHDVDVDNVDDHSAAANDDRSVACNDARRNG